MDIGVGLDATLNLSFDQQAELSQEAAQLGYTSVWTPESTGMTPSSFAPTAGRPAGRLFPRDFIPASQFPR